MAKRLSWEEAANLLDEYELTQMLHAHSVSEADRPGSCNSFAVSVYVSASGSALYVRADPRDPTAGCLVGDELEAVLPADVQLGEPYSESFVKALAAGEKRLRKSTKPPEPQGESN